MGSLLVTACGIVAGMVLTLAFAVVAVLAANGVDGAWASARQVPAAAGGTYQRVSFEPMAFQSLDLDGDGRISLAEAAGNHEVVAKFYRADRNRDGRLTRGEFERLKTLTASPAPVRPKLSRASDRKRAPQAVSDGP